MRDIVSPLDGLRSPFGVSRGPSGPTNSVAPVVSGTTTVGQTLSCTTGTWSGEGTITYAYQWKDDGADISGATSSTYTLQAAEEGGLITCAVTATDDNGSTAATSNSVGPVAAASSFTPADLFTSGEVGRWIHVHPDYLYQDVAMTTPAGVGDPVGLCFDRSGNGRHWTQSVSADRPTLQQDGSGNYYLTFDGLGDNYDIGTFARSDPYWTVWGIDIQSDTEGLFEYNGLSNFATAWESGSTASVSDAIGTLSVLAVDQVDVSPQKRGPLYTALSGGPKVFTSSYTGTTSSLAYAIGNYLGGNFHWTGVRVYGMVERDQMTSGERADLEAWMADQAGVTL